ncbi:cockayne syndrome 1 homolog [Ciona intestinalis]
MSYCTTLHSDRSLGTRNPRWLCRSIELGRILRLTLSETRIQCIPPNSISAMDLEKAECRYLICSGSDKKITIYDTWKLARDESNHGGLPKIATIGSKTRQKKYMHKSTMSSIQWYPHDTGIFVTSAFDGTIKIWDTNRLRPAETLEINCVIHNHHLSPISTQHSLIAAASADHIRLADIRSSATSHTLKGHRDTVLCVKWSPKDEYVLASGSEDNRVLIWDVRQAKAVLHNLDQHNGDTTASSAAVGTAHTGSVNSILFSEDGRYLLSFATDQRLHLWNTDTGKNTLVNYGRIDNPSKHRYLGMTLYKGGATSSIAFVPSGRQVTMLDFYTGAQLRRLAGHFSDVRCCEYNPYRQELYSAGQTSNVLIWSPAEPDSEAPVPPSGQNTAPAAASLLLDNWSDSD